MEWDGDKDARAGASSENNEGEVPCGIIVISIHATLSLASYERVGKGRLFHGVVC